MLVLSRQRDETVSIKVPGHDPIFVTVVDIRGDRVRIGFDAPRSIQINRIEVAKAANVGPDANPAEYESSIFEKRKA